MVRLAYMSNVWYVIDFGAKTFWTTTSISYLKDTVKIPVITGGTTAMLGDFYRIERP